MIFTNLNKSRLQIFHFKVKKLRFVRHHLKRFILGLMKVNLALDLHYIWHPFAFSKKQMVYKKWTIYGTKNTTVDEIHILMINPFIYSSYSNFLFLTHLCVE